VSSSRITVVRSGLPRPLPAADEYVVSDMEARAWVRGRILGHILRYDEGRLLTERLATAGRPMLAWLLRLVTRRRCYLADTEGREREITIPLLLRWSWQLMWETLRKGSLLRQVDQVVETLARNARSAAQPGVDRAASPLYLRTDLSFGVCAGGSVGHIAGVLNELRSVVGPPIFVTTAGVPTLRPEIEVHHVRVPEAFWNFKELPALALNDVVDAEARKALDGRPVAFVYQRYSLDNYAGLRLAQSLRVPFVLEYNGSEIWMARHWGHPLKYEALATRIELLNLRGADLVVVVSRAMNDELRERGVPVDRILVNPNAVDADRYSPEIDGSRVVERLGWRGTIVIGFIGTFGPWHGAHVLAQAFVELLRDRPAYRDTVRLLMIGDGAGRSAAQQILTSAGLDDRVAFTGLLPQEQGPSYLAACDILASPHVPNPDGSPFFGSPTKLFEYMAMGKAIVASDLDQIGEVLRHGETGWLVPPGDVTGLARGLAHLVDDRPLRAALGAAARRDVLARHTWRAHVRRTMDALRSREHAVA